MLLEFRVGNYRSIRDEQVFSLVAMDKDDQLLAENVQTTGNTQVPRSLRCAGVYGPNASGKSNLVQAMNIMQAIVRDSATLVQAGQALNVQAFALDPSLAKQPSTFELAVLLDGVRYQYGFSLTSERVHEEWLLVYKSAKPQEWFSRVWNAESGTEDYDFSKTYFTGNKDIWRQNTRSNALFLSTAILLNNEQLRPLWHWITNQWFIIPANTPLLINRTVEFFEQQATRSQVLEFMNSADFGIADIEVRHERAKGASFQFDAATGQAHIGEPFETEQLIPLFTHHGPHGKAVLAFGDESHGTQRHFALAGIVLHALKTGAVLVADELENSLHPLLVRHIIKIFQSKQRNPQGAQLVFTTHNTSLMDKDLFRRDQIWFTEKGTDLATVLFPLIDFHGVRSNEAFEKRYLEGRYGAIPILNDFMPGNGATDGQ